MVQKWMRESVVVECKNETFALVCEERRVHISDDQELLGEGLAEALAKDEKQIKLLWAAALEDIQPLMQLKDKDLLYVSASSATHKKCTWSVRTYKVMSSFDTSAIVDAFKARKTLQLTS